MLTCSLNEQEYGGTLHFEVGREVDLTGMYVNGVLSVIGRKWSGCRWPPWPASCYPWPGCSLFLQVPAASELLPVAWVFMVFAGSCPWQVAK